ncbi:DUF1569 domain-containing protein [Olivibacter ginsenosidimutans]
MENQFNKQNVLSGLEEKFGHFIHALSLFDAKQLNQQPAYGGWTAGQVADHMIKATAGLPDGHTKDAERAIDRFVPDLKAIFLDFDTQLQSPDFIYPGNGPFTKEALIDQLEKQESMLMENVQTNNVKAVCIDAPFPTLDFLTRYEWFMFIQFHLARHEHQLKKIHAALLRTSDTKLSTSDTNPV